MSITDTRTLPWSWYVDPAVLRLEHERIFRRYWQYVARVDEIAEPGDLPHVARGRPPRAPRPRPRGRPEGVPQRLSAPWLDRLPRVRQPPDAAVPVSRLDLRPRRPAPEGAALRARRRIRRGRARARARCRWTPGGRSSSSTRIPTRHRSPRCSRTSPSASPRQESTWTHFASCPAPSPSTRRTGRSAPRTSSSATTAPSRIPASRRRWTCPRTRTCSTSAPSGCRSRAHRSPSRAPRTTCPARWRLGNSTSSFPAPWST